VIRRSPGRRYTYFAWKFPSRPIAGKSEALAVRSERGPLHDGYEPAVRAIHDERGFLECASDHCAQPALFGVTIWTFSRNFGRGSPYRKTLLVCWGNLGLLYAGTGSATSRMLIRGELPPYITGAICRRILMAQLLYAFGVLLSIFNT
jgi:hypothetical protein